MAGFIARRLAHCLVSIVGASLIIFVISRLSGDPLALMLPVDAPADLVALTKQTLGLDRPLWQQYFIFAGNALHGDFGRSYRWEMPAMALVLDRLPATIELAVAALGFSVLLSVPLGILSAVYRGSVIDQFGRVLAMLGQAVPAFWIGLVLILVFAVALKWLPAFGSGDFQHVILPAISLGWYPVAAQTRIVRSGMLDVLQTDYIRMARSLGAPEWVLIWKYALRNAALPLVTMMGVYFASTLGGSFVVETIFAWPGLGRTVVEAVFSRDFPVVQAGVFIASLMFIFANLLVDISYRLIDPRIRG
jgi:peptide/nickel transport system permease protein